MNSRLIKALREIPVEGYRFLKKQYPPFVISPNPQLVPDTVPVFMYHRVTPDRLEQQLQFLHDNGYRTLRLDEFIAFLHGDLSLQAAAVLLTFDDGDCSWYDVAYPLLKKFGMKATGFLVPAFMKEHPNSGPWLSWTQVREMEAAGIFSFASHTFRHDRVFKSSRLIDFLHPSFDHNPLGLDTPTVLDPDGTLLPAPLGSPVYAHASRMRVDKLFLDHPTVRRECQQFVEDKGGLDFFENPDWRRHLLRHYKGLCRIHGRGAFADAASTHHAVYEDLHQAKAVLEKALQHPVQDLCLPWGEGSEMAVARAKEAGYRSCFRVCTVRNQNRKGDNPFYIPRLKEDYLTRLPGKGRENLIDLLRMKAQRRRTSTHIY